MQSPERHKYSTAVFRANRKYSGRITVDELAEIVDLSGRICYWCKKEGLAGGDLTFEHLEPANRKDCIVVACLRCNTERRERRQHGGDTSIRRSAREARRRWRAANPLLDKCVKAAANANRKYQGMGIVTAEELLRIIEACKRTCHWCQKKNLEGYNLTFEHLRRINEAKNIVLACRSCNAIRLSHGRRKLTAEEKREAELARKRARNAETKEQRAAYRRRYYAEHAEEIKAKAREYNAENRPKLARAKHEYDVKHYPGCREKKIAQAAAWKAANRERVLNQRRANYAKKKTD